MDFFIHKSYKTIGFTSKLKRTASHIKTQWTPTDNNYKHWPGYGQTNKTTYKQFPEGPAEQTKVDSEGELSPGRGWWPGLNFPPWGQTAILSATQGGSHSSGKPTVLLAGGTGGQSLCDCRYWKVRVNLRKENQYWKSTDSYYKFCSDHCLTLATCIHTDQTTIASEFEGRLIRNFSM